MTLLVAIVAKLLLAAGIMAGTLVCLAALIALISRIEFSTGSSRTTKRAGLKTSPVLSRG
jgi:hypothetical protein